MKNRLVIIIVCIVVILSVMIFYVMTAPKAKLPAANQVSTSPSPTPETASTSVTPGSYVDYKEGIIASTKGTKILFFHAPWCPQCRALENDIRTSSLPDNVTIIKVDYDSHQDLRQKYGVTIQTTLVKIDDTGKKLQSYVAYDRPTFNSVKNNLLDK